MFKVEIKPGGEIIDVEPGTTLAELAAKRTGPGTAETPMAAIAYNRLVGLDTALRSPTKVTFVDLSSHEGLAVYRRSATLLLLAAFKDLFPAARVVIGQSLADGHYFDVLGNGVKVTALMLAEVESRMREYVDQKTPIVKEKTPIEEARAYFEAEGHSDKVALLRARRAAHVSVVGLGSFRDLQHGPVATDVGPLQHFRLVPYPPGMVLRFDARDPEGRISEVMPQQTKLFQTYRETRAWNEIIGVQSVGLLNEAIIEGQEREIIRIGDGLHEKKVVGIADTVVRRRPDVRLILISGPSASGKTTFSKRLSLQLRVAGIRPVTLSLDNWYVNRVETPRDPATGDYDFECLEALDLPLFNDNLQRLMRGEDVRTPIYDFRAGVRLPESKWNKMHLADDQVLIAEGIHGLNDKLTASVAPQNKYKIYVSALTQLCLDDHNRIFTSDTRLIRRIVRDARYRGYDAETTILRWPSVLAGEQKYIFPFQESADVMFNTALVYEVAVLKVFAEAFLFAVPPASPAFPEAYRLLKFLEYFIPIFREDVPQISILREFIGGSSFAY
jgi:uridine kinase